MYTASFARFSAKASKPVTESAELGKTKSSPDKGRVHLRIEQLSSFCRAKKRKTRTRNTHISQEDADKWIFEFAKLHGLVDENHEMFSMECQQQVPLKTAYSGSSSGMNFDDESMKARKSIANTFPVAVGSVVSSCSANTFRVDAVDSVADDSLISVFFKEQIE